MLYKGMGVRAMQVVWSNAISFKLPDASEETHRAMQSTRRFRSTIWALARHRQPLREL